MLIEDVQNISDKAKAPFATHKQSQAIMLKAYEKCNVAYPLMNENNNAANIDSHVYNINTLLHILNIDLELPSSIPVLTELHSYTVGQRAFRPNVYCADSTHTIALEILRCIFPQTENTSCGLSSCMYDWTTFGLSRPFRKDKRRSVSVYLQIIWTYEFCLIVRLIALLSQYLTLNEHSKMCYGSWRKIHRRLTYHLAIIDAFDIQHPDFYCLCSPIPRSSFFCLLPIGLFPLSATFMAACFQKNMAVILSLIGAGFFAITLVLTVTSLIMMPKHFNPNLKSVTIQRDNLVWTLKQLQENMRAGMSFTASLDILLPSLLTEETRPLLEPLIIRHQPEATPAVTTDETTPLLPQINRCISSQPMGASAAAAMAAPERADPIYKKCVLSRHEVEKKLTLSLNPTCGHDNSACFSCLRRQNPTSQIVACAICLEKMPTHILHQRLANVCIDIRCESTHLPT